MINMLRIQFERFGSGLFPSLREYSKVYGLNSERLARCRKDVLVMHPGPDQPRRGDHLPRRRRAQ